MSTDSLKLTLQEFKSLLLVAYVYHFKPDAEWLIEAGTQALRDHDWRLWWEEEVFCKFNWFTPDGQTDFVKKLTRFIKDGGEQVLLGLTPLRYDRKCLAVSEIAHNLPIHLVKSFLKFVTGGPWAWKIDSEVVVYHSEEALYRRENSFHIPVEIPYEDRNLEFSEELSSSKEMIRLGQCSRTKRSNSLLMTRESWQNLLLLCEAYGFFPRDPAWLKWKLYYTFRNPSALPFRLRGYLRIYSFTDEESRDFQLTLENARNDNLAREASLKNGGVITDNTELISEAISRVVPSLLDAVITSGTRITTTGISTLTTKWASTPSKR